MFLALFRVKGHSAGWSSSSHGPGVYSGYLIGLKSQLWIMWIALHPSNSLGSSANNCIALVTTSDMSLMNNINKNDPRTLPWGIPLMRPDYDAKLPVATHYIFCQLGTP